jgi:hypothetical protein
MLLALALALAAACLAAAIALPSIDPCRVGDQFIPGCRLLAPINDRIGLRLTIGGVGLLAGAAVFLWARRTATNPPRSDSMSERRAHTESIP